jgi:hypothetical protein
MCVCVCACVRLRLRLLYVCSMLTRVCVCVCVFFRYVPETIDTTDLVEFADIFKRFQVRAKQKQRVKGIEEI